ncbi:PsiF family protein [Hydrogenophaga sp.]|uniref:PsiF family protein n=1 Tax=Hydrogenophaga sp. TaxID=1904254 RepID=UPI0025B7CF17|nr:PsiF family protein [Hydrogenophaga sp.]MBT9465354.1 hypothetical protein [Hydrogenophaga sp.]
MRTIWLGSWALAALLPLTSFAEGASCTASATEKKLAGAAKTSFMKKCEKDATATCDAAAVEKKIFGAAKTSFTKKCVKDSVGAVG